MTFHIVLKYQLIPTRTAEKQSVSKHCGQTDRMMNESLFAMDNSGKTSMSSNDSPDRTVRLNTALNTALIKIN